MKKGNITALKTNQSIDDYIAEGLEDKQQKPLSEATRQAFESMTNGTIEDIGFVGIVSDRDTLDEALEYFLDIIKSMPKEDQFPVNMALQLLLNTLSKNYLVIKKSK